MRRARCVDEALAQNHVASAFAMHRSGLSELTQAFEKSGGGGEFAGMKLGISAGQPAKVAIVRRRLVCEGREEAQFRPRSPPTLHNMRIEKRESDVSRD